jgi:hypothetical protein
MLAAGERRDGLVSRSRRTFATVVVVRVRRAGHPGIVAVRASPIST